VLGAALVASISCAAPAPALAADSARRAAREIVVKLRADGPHAVGECAETLVRQRRSFAGASADRSDSLDRLQAEMGVRRLRAVFRRPDGRPLAEQRRALAAPRARTGRAALRANAPRTDLSHVYLIELGPGADPPRAAARYREDPHVEWAQANYRIEAADFAPDDPFLFSSGSWEQPFADLWGLFAIRADVAWQRALGEGVLVAVVDTGIDPNHPDLAANVWVNPGEDLNGDGRAGPEDLNGLDDDGNGFADDLHGFDFANSFDANGDGDYTDDDDFQDADPFDDHGHGTHLAGTIAAVGEDGLGVIGVAPRARIMAVKGLDEAGSGLSSDLAAGIVYAARNGARAINNSWSCGTRCPSNPVAEEAVRFAFELGAVPVFSAGNKQDDVMFYSPQNMREALSVAASDPADEIASFSNFGLLVDLAAPGAGLGVPPPAVSPLRGLLSAKSSGSVPAIDGGGLYVLEEHWVRLSGTSMSAPHVVGAVALLASLHPDSSNEDLRNALRMSARDLGAAGHDDAYGDGVVDAGAAVALDPVPHLRAAIDSPERNAALTQRDGRIEIRGTAAGRDFAEYELEAGRGDRPPSWAPIGAGSGAVESGVLGSWDVAELDDGPWMLRLTARSTSGAAIVEFQPVSLDRNPPTLLSPREASASAPAISGALVTWQEQAVDDADGLDVVVRDLATARSTAIATGPGDQRAPELSRGLVAWQDTAGVAPAFSIRSCDFDRSRARCKASRLATVDGEDTGPVVSAGRIVWSGPGSAASDLFVCEPRHGRHRCRPRPIVAAPGDQFDARIDGDRMVWIDHRNGASQMFTCRIDPWKRACPDRQVLSGATHHFEPSISGSIVVWKELYDLAMCELDPRTGACPRQVITSTDDTNLPDVSGDRIAWREPAPGGGFDLYFCEYDAVRKSCPRQLVSRARGDQSAPAVDRNRVVWEDGRFGGPHVMLLELPTLDAGRDRRVAAGRTLWIQVVARDPLGGPMALRAELADGSDVASVGAGFRADGRGHGWLRWTPTAAQVGAHAFTFTGRSAGRLETQETIRVEVSAR
jgi:subtilisin family serine protease